MVKISNPTNHIRRPMGGAFILPSVARVPENAPSPTQTRAKRRQTPTKPHRAHRTRPPWDVRTKSPWDCGVSAVKSLAKPTVEACSADGAADGGDCDEFVTG